LVVEVSQIFPAESEKGKLPKIPKAKLFSVGTEVRAKKLWVMLNGSFNHDSKGLGRRR
jgi:hypothetical protein